VAARSPRSRPTGTSSTRTAASRRWPVRC
jgi:hypothetical protein